MAEEPQGRPSTTAPKTRPVQVPPDLQDPTDEHQRGRAPRHPFERSDVDDAGAPPQGGVPGRQDGVVVGQSNPSAPTQDPGQGLDEPRVDPSREDEPR
jgi:hypothetical protein